MPQEPYRHGRMTKRSKRAQAVADAWRKRLMNPPKPADKYPPDELVLRPERVRQPKKPKGTP